METWNFVSVYDLPMSRVWKWSKDPESHLWICFVGLQAMFVIYGGVSSSMYCTMDDDPVNRPAEEQLRTVVIAIELLAGLQPDAIADLFAFCVRDFSGSGRS